MPPNDELRIPLRDLEELRRDPKAYIRRRKNQEEFFSPKSKHQILLRSVFTYHATNGDLDYARSYLQKIYKEKEFKDKKGFQSLIEKLDSYVNSFTQLKSAVFDIRRNIIVPLPEDISGIRVSGQIPRLDITSTGYLAWLFARETSQWESEIRLPIIQSVCADILAANIDEVSVGIYDFSVSAGTVYNFSQGEVEEAKEELIQSVRQIVK